MEDVLPNFSPPEVVVPAYWVRLWGGWPWRTPVWPLPWSSFLCEETKDSGSSLLNSGTVRESRALVSCGSHPCAMEQPGKAELCPLWIAPRCSEGTGPHLKTPAHLLVCLCHKTRWWLHSWLEIHRADKKVDRAEKDSKTKEFEQENIYERINNTHWLHQPRHLQRYCLRWLWLQLPVTGPLYSYSYWLSAKHCMRGKHKDRNKTHLAKELHALEESRKNSAAM